MIKYNKNVWCILILGTSNEKMHLGMKSYGVIKFNIFSEEMGKQHFEVNIRSDVLKCHLRNRRDLRTTSIGVWLYRLWHMCKWNIKQEPKRLRHVYVLMILKNILKSVKWKMPKVNHYEYYNSYLWRETMCVHVYITHKCKYATHTNPWLYV